MIRARPIRRPFRSITLTSEPPLSPDLRDRRQTGHLGQGSYDYPLTLFDRERHLSRCGISLDY